MISSWFWSYYTTAPDPAVAIRLVVFFGLLWFVGTLIYNRVTGGDRYSVPPVVGALLDSFVAAILMGVALVAVPGILGGLFWVFFL